MAVIVTNREVPIRCVTCWHRMNCEYWEQTVEGYKNRNCPIKELDKNVALYKIKAEMLEEMLSHSGTGEEVIQAYADGLKKGIDFIDKYKAESEKA